MKTAFLVIVFVLFVAGCCAPQKRLNRLVRKHPELVKTQIRVIDTLVRVEIPEVRIDTIIPTPKVNDTAYITNDSIQIKLVRLKGDSIYVEGVTKTRTITVPVKVPCECDTVTVQEKSLVERVIMWTAIIVGILGAWAIVCWILRNLVC